MMLLTGLNIYAQDSAAPDMNLLEFLGEGVKVDNEVVDPMSWQAMEDMTGSDQEQKQTAHTRQDADRQQDSRRQDHE